MTQNAILGVLAVTALVLVAGCGSAVDAGTTTAPTTATTTTPGTTTADTSTTTATTTTATTTTTPGPGATAPLADHESALEAAGSYTVEYQFRAEGADSATIQGRVLVDTFRETQFLRLTLAGQGPEFDVSQYREPGADFVYTRVAFDGGVQYLKQDLDEAGGFGDFDDPFDGGPTGDDGATGRPPEFRYTGVVNTPEGPRDRYVVDDVRQLETPRLPDGGRITAIEIVVLVDRGTGIATEFTYDATIRDHPDGLTGIDFRVAYTDVGSTVVPVPDWLEEAKSRTR